KATTAVSTTSLDWEHAYAVDMEGRWEGTEAPQFLFGAFAGRELVGFTDSAKTKFVRQFIQQENPRQGYRPQVYKVPAGSKLFLQNVKYRPRGLQSVFNGKDLTGWREIPGKKSKFTVTDKGELNVKDGPGDLQTAGEWDDFILQIDVFSNG